MARNNNTEIYSTRNEGKSVAVESFIGTSRNEIDEYMTAILKNVYIDKLLELVKQYNNAIYRSVKMTSVKV